MKDWSYLRERFLRDDLPVRLGGLAANLARLRSFGLHDASRDVVESVIEESKYFIEWTASEVNAGAAAELIDLQVVLAGWQRNWSRIWSDSLQRNSVLEQAGVWSKRVLEMSGLTRG